MMATSVPQRTVLGPPPGLAFNLDEWVPCEVYLGCIKQNETETATNTDLARVVARLHRRHERNNKRASRNATVQGNEVYVKVIHTGLLVRVMTPLLGRQTDDGGREGTKEFFETVRIARCSANHEPCPRALVWVYNRQPVGGGFTGDGAVECHGVMCRDLRDATRLANTMAMAFYEMRQQPVAIGNAFGSIGSAVPRGLPMDLPPAYTPTFHHVLEAPPRRNRRRDRQQQVLHTVTADINGDGSNDYELVESPRSPGPRSTSPRVATPRNTTRTSVGNSTVSLNTLDDIAARRTSRASMNNSTLSLHSTIGASAVSSLGCGRKSTDLPDVDSGFDWGSSNV